MSKHDDDVIDHNDLYDSDLDDDVAGDLEYLLNDAAEEIAEPEAEADQEDPVEQGTVRIRFNASLNGYRRGDEVTVDVNDQFFGGLIKQKLVEVL